MAAISQANSTNKMAVFKKQQAVTSEFLCTRKTWADQCEEEEDDDFDNNLGDSYEEADHGSYTSNERVVELHKEQVSSSSQRVQIKKGLSPNAPVFVPSGQRQIAEVSVKDDPNSKALTFRKDGKHKFPHCK
ncbi:hypothetical protein A4A49_45292, partial [Nicotiana attenuata]